MAKATGPLYNVHFKRRREGRTDYEKRLSLLKSGKARLVVRKANKSILVQVIVYGENGDKTVASATSKVLAKFGFPGKSNTPSAFLTGLLCGVKAKEKGVSEVVLDVGLHTPSKGSVVFAALKGALQAGLNAKVGEEKLPSEERIAGKHLSGEIAVKFEDARQKILASGVKG
ncbi:MAG: 50S ribosomal protein L18 [Candidatus Micrarchaeota archaeon]